MLTHTVPPVLVCEDSEMASQTPAQLQATPRTVHEVFLERAAHALELCCMTSSFVRTDGLTAGRREDPETEAHSADLTGVSAAVVGAEVSLLCTSLDVGVERKACPGCGDALLWTNHSGGRCIKGLACDNHLVCRKGVWLQTSPLNTAGACVVRDATVFYQRVRGNWPASTNPRVRMRPRCVMRALPMEEHGSFLPLRHAGSAQKYGAEV